MIFYLVVALVLLLVVVGIFKSYKHYHDRQKLFSSLALLVLLFVFVYSSKILIIYKPILILHLALLFWAFYHYIRYLKGSKLSLVSILSPLFSIALFILVSLYFRENG